MRLTATIIGDSIAMAYGPLVKELLAGQVEVWPPEENAGTSENVLAHLDEWVLGRPANLVHLNCGLHDLAIDEGRQHRRVDVDRYTANLARIFSHIRDGSPARLVWATITPVIDERQEGVTACREADVLRYNAAALQVAHDLPINDLHQAIIQGGPEECICEDGMHVTPRGNALLAEAVGSSIRGGLDL